MKRLRLERWSSQLLGAARPASSASSSCPHSFRNRQMFLSRRSQSTLAAAESAVGGADDLASQKFAPLDPVAASSATFPSPPPERALSSAKLAALHARLSLPEKIPLQTLARTLIDATADENPQFNNSNLSFLGQTLINYHISEWLMCRYPRLPMSIVYAAMSAYGGSKPLHHVARGWGVESAGAPGGEVDPGLLQFSLYRWGVTNTTFGYQRTEADKLDKFKWRRGISSRVVLDDDFGDVVRPSPGPAEPADPAAPLRPYGGSDTRQAAEHAHAQFVRAVVGAVYAHCGREAVKAFVKAHVLSRQLNLEALFSFKQPTRELARLCAREEFERPVARLLSETGRQSRTPVFVVGIYSGADKLGEGAGPNLDAARWKAAMNALKAWYLYSPGDGVRVPSDMLADDAAPWDPAYIDVGEVI